MKTLRLSESEYSAFNARQQSCAEQNVLLVLPWPVSANRYWRTVVINGIARTYVSPEAKSYRAIVALAARDAGIKRPIEGRVSVEFELYPARPKDWQRRQRKDPHGWDDSVSCLDLDNTQKVLLDSLKGVVIVDDRWVRRIVADRMEPDERGARIEVRVAAK